MHFLHENVNLIEVLQHVWISVPLQWSMVFFCSRNLSKKNWIDYKTFAKVLKTSLEKGRQKHLNIMLHDPADFEKIFLFRPVCSLFLNVFRTPGWNWKYFAHYVIIGHLCLLWFLYWAPIMSNKFVISA